MTEPASNPWREIEDTYFDLLEVYYGKRQKTKAYPLALHLSRLLEEHDPNCEAMLGMAGRCLIAELDGDLEAAIRYRRMQITGVKKLLDELDAAILDAIKMGPADYSDELDLLAINYLDLGRHKEALETLAESETFCKEHGIPFDGKDIRADVRRAMRRKRTPAVQTKE